MDRDTVRWILVVVGALVLLGTYVWGRYGQRIMDFIERRDEFEAFDRLADEELEEDAVPAMASTAASHGRGVRIPPTLHVAPVAPAAAADPVVPVAAVAEPESEPDSAPAAPPEAAPSISLGAPFLIQLSLIADHDEFFRGEALYEAFQDEGLIHGEMGIYHRYDAGFRETLFSIASLIEPGTFPADDMEGFACPGIILFFQPARVAHPVAVFDDLIVTLHSLADRLGGVEWDERREELSDMAIFQMRRRLQALEAE